jgi:hypothetical protein
VAFIEASTHESSLAAMQAFAAELQRFGQATVGSRHDAMLRIISWAFAMNALDLRTALAQIKTAWLALTAGEGREDEVTDVATWVVGQEQAKRAAPIDVYQPGESIFLDWQAFANRDTTVHRWLVENFWPWGRAMALWASAKEGKSELALWCAAKLALGEHPWTGQPIEPVDIAYFDFEMTEDDLEERLSDFGFDPLRLEHLHYAILPTLPPLDSNLGGEALLQWVTSVDAKAVVIDTFARSVIGPEDKSDTVGAFARCTGNRLKALGIGYLRTDHAGHDTSKNHARGSSAKRDDVDVAWRQHRTSSGVALDCTGSSRLGWVGPHLRIDRITNPTDQLVSYSSPISFGVPAGVSAKIAELDQLKVPLDAGRPAAIRALQAAGLKPGRIAVLAAALKARKERPATGVSTSGTAAPAPSGNESDGTNGNSEEPPDLFSS